MDVITFGGGCDHEAWSIASGEVFERMDGDIGFALEEEAFDCAGEDAVAADIS